MKLIFFIMALTPGIAIYFSMRSLITGFEGSLFAKITLWFIYILLVIVIKAAFIKTPMFDFGLSDLLSLFRKGSKGSDEEIIRDYAAEVRKRERKRRTDDMPAEQLAFVRAVAAAAGYVEGAEDMSPDLEYVIRNELRKLSGGREILEEELLGIFRTQGDHWEGMCFFGNDPERVSVFFGILAEIIIGDAMVSDEEKQRFAEIAEHFGYSAEEALGMLRDSARFRRFWGYGNGRPQSGGSVSDEIYHAALETLGVTDLDDDREVKKAYMRLAQRYHPDKVRNRGYGDDVLKMYQRKFETVTDAWNSVRERRGI